MKLLLKPLHRNIDVKSVKPSDIEYFCKTRVIDKIVYESRGLAFDEMTANMMEQPHPFYFLLLKSGQYDVVNGVDFDPIMQEHGLKVYRNHESQAQRSKFAHKAIKHFIKKVHRV